MASLPWEASSGILVMMAKKVYQPPEKPSIARKSRNTLRSHPLVQTVERSLPPIHISIGTRRSFNSSLRTNSYFPIHQEAVIRERLHHIGLRIESVESTSSGVYLLPAGSRRIIANHAFGPSSLKIKPCNSDRTSKRTGSMDSTVHPSLKRS